MDAVKTTNLKMVYLHNAKSVKAIDGLSFSIGEEEFVSIVGPSGCGKTTLLKCLSGLISPTSGSLSINGKLNLVFQEYSKSLFAWKSVRDNIVFGLKRGGRQDAGDVAELIKTVRLKGFEDHYPYQLSGGMQQRLAIARALAYDPKIIFMDEPFGSLDAQTRMRLEDELLAIWQKFKKTIVFVTHDIEEAIYLSDRILVLSKRPARVVADIKIHLKRPRSQVETRQDSEFIATWKKIYTLLEQR